MEGVEWRRLIAPLLYVSELSVMSKLQPACSKPPSTPSGHSFNPLENHLKNPKKFLFVLSFEDKILIDHEDAEQYFYLITDFLNLTDFRLAQRRPVVIAAPTTGADNHGRLDHLYLTQKPFIFNDEFNESSRIFLFVSQPHTFM